MIQEALETIELSEANLLQIRETLENDFAAFALATFPNRDFFDDSLHGDLCDFLQYDVSTEGLVILPRSFLKTTIVARYILWRALKDPEIRILYVSNTATNAEKTIGEVMGIVEKNPLIQAVWPDRIPESFNEHWSVQSATLKRTHTWPEGTFESAGVGTNIIKRHYNIIVQDDTVAPTIDSMSGEEMMPTRDEIDKAVGFHKLTMPLMVDINSGLRLVTGTRWAGEDLIFHIMTNEKSFKIFDRAAILDNGKPAYKRYNQKTLDKIRDTVGTYMFMALYMNSPQASEHMSFKQRWIKYWDELPMEGRRTVTVDPADPPTGKKHQDYTAIISCIFCDKGLFVVRSRRDRMTPAEIVKNTLDIATEDNTDVIRVEVNRHPYLEKEFMDEMLRRSKFFRVEYVKTQRAKEARIMALQPLYESGRVFHNRNCKNLEMELISFPNGKHDDEIDALAWQLESYVRVPQAADVTDMASLSNYKFEVTFEDLMEELTATSAPYGSIGGFGGRE